MAVSKSYREFLEAHPNTFILGVTATPYTREPLRHIANTIVRPITFSELVEQKHLVAARYFIPTVPNLKKVKIQSGEYNLKQLSDVMGTSKISGDIVEHWKKYGENRPTLCFAVSIEHSRKIEAEFLSAGIPIRHCDADSPDREREDAIADLKSGRVKILTNVGLWGTGVDIPFLSCIIMARPTKSYILHIQQLGRGTRTFEGKKDFIVLDHAGNIKQHGMIEMDLPGSLDGTPHFPSISVKTCKSCFAVIKDYPCEECGFIPNPEDAQAKPRDFSTDKTIELKEIGSQKPTVKFTHADILADIAYWDQIILDRGYNPNMIWHKIKKLYGEQIAKNYLGARFRKSSPASR